ncbi:MAG: dCTP deaminase [bacterium]|jgi:deoxycytidine triphosphate deaminase
MIDTRIEELAIKGMIEPFHSECVQPCSYDVHLGDLLLVETENGFRKQDISKHTDKDPLQMPPGCFVLGETVEYLRIPRNVEAHLHLVSSRAREGLNHLLSGLVDCGYNGRLTLELKNSLQFGFIPLYPGLRIAQLTFFEYAQDAGVPYRGRYFGDSRVSMTKRGKDLLVS